VPARLELEGGVHSRFEERLGVGDSMGKVVVHRPGGGRGVKHCDQVGQMEWVGCLSVYLRQSQITYSSLVQSIMWPCMSRLQTVVGLRNIKKTPETRTLNIKNTKLVHEPSRFHVTEVRKVLNAKNVNEGSESNSD
jgi:hypothetical protein